MVHRSDGSGTSWIFTSYLSAVSPTWKSQVGANTSPAWPVGTGGAKSAGVAALVQQVSGSIGYVEYTYAQQNNISTVKMMNAAGKVVAPTLAGFAAAAKNATWDATQGFAHPLVNEPGATELADHRRHVRPRAEEPARRLDRADGLEVLRLGIQERRVDRRRA